MFEKAPSTRVSECNVCFAPHNDEIHEATLRIHQWFQQQVTKNFWEETAVVESELLEVQVA